MEFIVFAVLLAIAGVLAIIGFFTQPSNPYMILFAALVMLVISANLLAEGLEVPNGQSIQVNSSSYISELDDVNISNRQYNATISDVNTTPTGIRSNSLNIIILLLSLYLAFLGVGIIIENKYG